MENKNVMKMTKKELMNLKNFKTEESINGIVVVPMNYQHDSGFQCMKFVLLNNEKIVGVVGGSSDVIHVNGICGYGKFPDYNNNKVNVNDLRIDCLPKSKCLRLFSYKKIEINEFVGSDFVFYFKDDE